MRGIRRGVSNIVSASLLVLLGMLLGAIIYLSASSLMPTGGDALVDATCSDLLNVGNQTIALVDIILANSRGSPALFTLQGVEVSGYGPADVVGGFNITLGPNVVTTLRIGVIILNATTTMTGVVSVEVGGVPVEAGFKCS